MRRCKEQFERVKQLDFGGILKGIRSDKEVGVSKWLKKKKDLGFFYVQGGFGERKRRTGLDGNKKENKQKNFLRQTKTVKKGITHHYPKQKSSTYYLTLPFHSITDTHRPTTPPKHPSNMSLQTTTAPTHMITPTQPTNLLFIFKNPKTKKNPFFNQVQLSNNQHLR